MWQAEVGVQRVQTQGEVGVRTVRSVAASHRYACNLALPKLFRHFLGFGFRSSLLMEVQYSGEAL
jgi:hypothetical protein